MNRWFFSEDSSESSSNLSMADDCESVKSIESLPIKQSQPDLRSAHYEMPIFTKTSGESILFLTNLYLPVKRHRNQTENLIKDFECIRKLRNYKTELQEFYTELLEIEPVVVSDRLLEHSDNYIKRYLNRLTRDIKSDEAEEDVQFEKETGVDPRIQMVEFDRFSQKLPRKKGKHQELRFRQKEVSSSRILQKTQFINEMDLNFLQGILKPNRSRKIELFYKDAYKGRPALSAGGNSHYYNEPHGKHWGLAKIPEQKSYFRTEDPQLFLKFPKAKINFDSFYHRFPSTLQLEQLIFNNNNSEYVDLLKKHMSRLFIVPVNENLEVNSDSSSEPEEIQSESEEKDQVLPKFIENDGKLHHSKFSYKHHLNKIRWSESELQNFHRPKSRILEAFTVKLDLGQCEIDRPPENPFSYMSFTKSDDLTLSSGEFILVELIEKHPPLLSNCGMASKVQIYSTSEDVSHRSPGEIGAFADPKRFVSIRILPSDASMHFLENNLYIAPIFSHNSNPRDFLLVHTSYGWKTRSFSMSYTLGQLEPKIEVCCPKSKSQREFKDKHVISAIYRAMIKRGNLTKHELKEITKEMNYNKVKKIAADYKLVNENDVWSCEKGISKEETLRIITPEEFCSYESMLVGLSRLEELGISITSVEKLQQAVLTVLNEFEDRKIRYLAGYIEEKVALASWNLTAAYLKGRKRKNFQVYGRADPTCGNCGYSFELYPKSSTTEQKSTETLLKKVISQEIKHLGLAKYKDYSSEESEEEVVNFEMIDEPSEPSKPGSPVVDEESSLQHLLNSMDTFKAPPLRQPKKILKRVTITPTLHGKYIKKIQYIVDASEIEKFSQKKKVVPKFFLPKTKFNEEELMKRFKEKEAKKLLKTAESQKKKAEKKLGKIKEKLMKEQEWKNICLEKYNSGAVLFNTGTNCNVKCSRCNMIGHTKNNRKLCPAFIEEAVDLNLESKVVLSLKDIQKEEPKALKGKKGRPLKSGVKKGVKKVAKVEAVVKACNEKPKNRRDIDEFQELILKIIGVEKDKSIISGEKGLMSMLEKCEKGYKYEMGEFEQQLEEIYGDGLEIHSEKIEELKYRKQIKETPIAKPPKKQPKKKIEFIEDFDTLIINTL